MGKSFVESHFALHKIFKGYKPIKKTTYYIDTDDHLDRVDNEIKQIEHHLSSLLNTCNLDSMVTVDTIRMWMQDLDLDDKNIPIYMISSLLNDDLIEQTDLLEELFNTMIRFNQVIPLKSLNGRTFDEQLKERKEKKIPTHVNFSQRKIPMRDWCESYDKAMWYMHQQQFDKATEEFDETFRRLLESKIADPDIFRVFCNAGIAYLFSGEVYVGVGCISIAKELNPKYSLACEQYRRIEEGEFHELIELGLMTKILNNFKTWDKRPAHLHLDEVMTWSEGKILKKLSSYGITVDKDEFIRIAKTVNTPGGLAEKLFYPHASITSQNEDFFWIAAYELWEKYCPEEESINGFQTVINDAYEYVSNKDIFHYWDATLKKEEIKQLQTHVQKIKKFVFSNKKDFLYEWSHTIEVNDSAYLLREFLISILPLPDFRKEVLAIVSQILKTKADPYWEHIHIINQLQNDEIKGMDLLRTIQKKYPYDCSITSEIGRYYMDRNNYDAAETYFLDALDIIDERAKEEVYTIDTSPSTIYDDYHFALKDLEKLYELKRLDVEQRKWLKNKRKQIEKKRKKLSYSPQDEQINESMIDIIERGQLEDAEKSYPMQYYMFLSQLNINFETDTVAKTVETYIPVTARSMLDHTENKKKNISKKQSGDRKIGRNDPCPCGSGKKYKKCCGSSTIK